MNPTAPHNAHANPPAPHGERYARGWQKLQEVDDIAGERVVASLADIAPDLGRYIVEFGFGDIYSRPGLTLREREIATIAALTALGNAAPQLKVHIEAGLNVGLTREAITETILQMALYAGFPAALNGMFAAKAVFADQDAAADASGASTHRDTSN
ncbi:carboxymuconolactone decarboxylase family protein [Ralstonia solanacearum]|uniref:carboxymuconolactone decarboxylase family protein n=1 Tax=Ralstonia solanacearum TaxID=305 RepID=UPI0005AC458A|nr:carboxymuconolactone decarboxylase family protein [Ralstonia solanacearum]AMP69727.1 carboxymuconolactone decarboxylase [Ralstonia solanacearum]AMP73363.1 carboxymuconolactone decarboxylase [Ralstonia solanacearum]AYB60109.1 carboxymuconolactone decarboxylase [Ralstonia solanacearum]MBB6586917.1 carboxymuconolactone decarboxylase family protein [Ralstonia solanacearum]MCG3576742.1 carboxymuconolactone decarboxylase family protein [Ralstonia solanacearum]